MTPTQAGLRIEADKFRKRQAYIAKHGYDPEGMSVGDVGGVEKNNLLQYAPSKWENLQTKGSQSLLKTGKLSDKAELIAPEWARMARSARRLRRKGYRQASQEMALRAEEERGNTPSIRSQGFRGEDKRRREGIEASKKEQRDLTRRLIEEMLKGRRSPTEDAIYRGPYYGPEVRM